MMPIRRPAYAAGERPTILDALDMWSCWHGECSPLGATGNYSLDMLLADAFRALLYRPGNDAKLDWLRRPRTPHNDHGPFRRARPRTRFQEGRRQ